MGLLDVMRVLTLSAWVLNYSSKVEFEQTQGGGGGIRAGRARRTVDQSVFDQLGEGAGSLNLGESRVISTGTWSEPVERRGVSHLETDGWSSSLAKEKSRTEGLALCAKGKYL